jgi:hypothetical protein
MTILVGMTCSNGIILAADQCMVRQTASASEFDDRVGIRKIENLARHHVAYAAAGDEISWCVGRALTARLNEGTFEFADIGTTLEEIGAGTFNNERTKIENCHGREEDRQRALNMSLPRGLLVVFYGQKVREPQLWGLNIDAIRCFARRIDGIVISLLSKTGQGCDVAC